MALKITVRIILPPQCWRVDIVFLRVSHWPLQFFYFYHGVQIGQSLCPMTLKHSNFRCPWNDRSLLLGIFFSFASPQCWTGITVESQEHSESFIKIYVEKTFTLYSFMKTLLDAFGHDGLNAHSLHKTSQLKKQPVKLWQLYSGWTMLKLKSSDAIVHSVFGVRMSVHINQKPQWQRWSLHMNKSCRSCSIWYWQTFYYLRKEKWRNVLWHSWWESEEETSLNFWMDDQLLIGSRERK